jgi:type IV pilus assembly protein PilA
MCNLSIREIMINLPKKVNSKGFTLIELLVVISIIAVLAVIALSVFGNVQKSARDTRRRTEVDAISKSLETTRNPGNQSYTYTTTATSPAPPVINSNVDFPNGLPADPVTGWGKYCIAVNATAPNPPANAVFTDNTCPTTGGVTYVAADQTGLNLSAVGAWTVCARLEVDGSSFCKSSLVR